MPAEPADFPSNRTEHIGYSTGVATVAAGATVYVVCTHHGGSFLGTSYAAGNHPYTTFISPRRGVLMNLVCRSYQLAGVGETYVYTVYINGVATVLTCSHGGAVDLQSSDLGDRVNIAAGDRVALQVVASAAAVATTHIIYVGLMYRVSHHRESLLFSGYGTSLGGALTNFLYNVDQYGNSGGSIAGLSYTPCQYLVTKRAEVRNLCAMSSIPPGGVTTYTFTLMVNGVASILTCQIAGAIAVSSQDLANIVNVAPGDWLGLRWVGSAGSVGAEQCAVVEVVEK